MKRSDIPTEAVLLALFHNGGDVCSYLMRKGAPEKVVYAAFVRDLNKGFLDYSPSLQTAWVTEKGYKFLNQI